MTVSGSATAVRGSRNAESAKPAIASSTARRAPTPVMSRPLTRVAMTPDDADGDVDRARPGRSGRRTTRG